MENLDVPIKNFAVSQFSRGKNHGFSIRTNRYRLTIWIKDNYRTFLPFDEKDIHKPGLLGAYHIQCMDCHLHETAELNPDLFVLSEDDEVLYVPVATGESLPIPQIEHPAHDRYGDRVSCQACHAQWTYNDAPTHLLRIDHEEFDDFYKLSLDGSSEVLRILSSHSLYDGDLLEPVMSNKLTGVEWPGIWFRGFGERRWEQVLLDRDESGRVTTVRPILDLRLSWIDADEESRFDNLEPLAGIKRSIPYAPHTIGRAGLFYEARIRPFLTSEEKN